MKRTQASTRFVLRTPLLPFAEWLAWPGSTGDRRTVRARLEELLARPEVEEALFIASPSLHRRLAHWRAAPDSEQGRKVEHALVRYISRMAGRSTPFGLFSGVSVGRVGTHTALELEARSGYQRHTRIDNDFLFALTSAVAADPQIRRRLRYRPNSSLYAAAGRLRYAEARLNGKERSYHLVSVEANECLQATLERARAGARLADLAAALVVDDPEIDLPAAEAYVGELIEAQLLLPEMGVAVTGPEPLETLLAVLQEVDAAPVSGTLREVRTQLAAMDRRGTGVEPACYLEAAKALEAASAEVPAEISRLFQVDMVKPAPQAELSRALVAEIERGIDLLRRISPRSEDSLATFRRAFRDRYENREVALVEALDEESGIGFEVTDVPSMEGSPLLAGLDFPNPPEWPRIDWNDREEYLLGRVHQVIARGAEELVLDDKDLRRLEAAEPARLPQAFATMVRVAAPSREALQRGELCVLVEAVSGPSGARLLGRFCHASSDLHDLVRDHLRTEEALAPDAIFAEIVHLNEGRIGNVLCRPVLRDYEIPFLGISGASHDRQLQITDLLVSVRGEQIVLRSRRLGCRVIPRLTTAHNFRRRNLGIYRFLGELQSQGCDPVAWQWGGALAGAPRLPRVRHGRVVFARAQWRLGQANLAPVAAAVRAESRAATAVELEARRADTLATLKRLRVDHGLPRFVVLAEGDNELPIDFENALSADAFAHALAARADSPGTSVILYEQFPPPDELVVDGPEGAFTHEIIVPFIRAEASTTEQVAARATASQGTVTRSFAPGSTWLYAKLYTGRSTADRVLREAVAPVAREALANGDAQCWFFLRYQDPDPQVRVRFRGAPERLCSTVLPALHRALAPLVEEGAIWRVQLDTYQREVERYGGAHGIELAEELFWIDSETVLAIVEGLEGDAGKDARWRLAVRGSDLLLEDLGLDAAARERVFAKARDSFGHEFHATSALQKQMGSLFRDRRTDLERLLSRASGCAQGHPLEPGFQLLAHRSGRLRAVADELRTRARRGLLDATVEDIAWSFVHMHINRLLHASQRAQELVIYDLLKRYYAACRACAAPAGDVSLGEPA